MKHDEGQQVRRFSLIADDKNWYEDSVWEYHLRPDELPLYHDVAARHINRLLRIPPTARKRLPQVAIRCPVRGCLLATIYPFTMREPDPVPGGTYYLYVGHTPSRGEVWDIINYSCACGQALFWVAGCRCGSASLDRAWMVELFYNEDVPDKRVCHPEPAAWHAKKVRNPCASVPANSKSRPRCSR